MCSVCVQPVSQAGGQTNNKGAATGNIVHMDNEHETHRLQSKGSFYECSSHSRTYAEYYAKHLEIFSVMVKALFPLSCISFHNIYMLSSTTAPARLVKFAAQIKVLTGSIHTNTALTRAHNDKRLHS